MSIISFSFSYISFESYGDALKNSESRIHRYIYTHTLLSADLSNFCDSLSSLSILLVCWTIQLIKQVIIGIVSPYIKLNWIILHHTHTQIIINWINIIIADGDKKVKKNYTVCFISQIHTTIQNAACLFFFFFFTLIWIFQLNLILAYKKPFHVSSKSFQSWVNILHYFTLCK